MAGQDERQIKHCHPPLKFSSILSFKHGVKLAVNHDGDSDSTGAIAGNLLGALYGDSAIPAKWLQPLELRGVITEVAHDLHDFRSWQLDDTHAGTALAQRLRTRYPVQPV